MPLQGQGSDPAEEQSSIMTYRLPSHQEVD